MLLCRIIWGCFLCPPPLKLLKLSGVLCCYAVGSEVMVNQWSPGRLKWLRWCFFYILEKLFQIKLILWYWPSCSLALTRLVLMVLLTPSPPKNNAITMAMVVAVLQSVQWWRPITGLACNSFWRTATTCGKYSRTIPQEQHWKTRRICCLRQVQGQLVSVYVCYCPLFCMFICPKAKITMMIYHDLRDPPKSCNIPK